MLMDKFLMKQDRRLKRGWKTAASRRGESPPWDGRPGMNRAGVTCRTSTSRPCYTLLLAQNRVRLCWTTLPLLYQRAHTHTQKDRYDWVGASQSLLCRLHADIVPFLISTNYATSEKRFVDFEQQWWHFFFNKNKQEEKTTTFSWNSQNLSLNVSKIGSLRSNKSLISLPVLL